MILFPTLTDLLLVFFSRQMPCRTKHMVPMIPQEILPEFDHQRKLSIDVPSSSSGCELGCALPNCWQMILFQIENCEILQTAEGWAVNVTDLIVSQIYSCYIFQFSREYQVCKQIIRVICSNLFIRQTRRKFALVSGVAINNNCLKFSICCAIACLWTTWYHSFP